LCFLAAINVLEDMQVNEGKLHASKRKVIVRGKEGITILEGMHEKKG